MGALGGLVFLIGLGVAFYGHLHMGEGPMESARGPVEPFGLYIGGLITAGLGLLLSLCSLAYGCDGTPIDYSRFFKESSQ